MQQKPTVCLPESISLPKRTLVGRGRIADLVKECSLFGARGVILHGASLRKNGQLDVILKASGGTAVLPVEHTGNEPDLGQLRALLSKARDFKTDWIAAVGGGSVIDLAKACAGLFNAGNDPVVYHDGKTVEKPGIPFIAAPTTAGTGAEASPNSVLTNSDTHTKKSIRDDAFVARTVILDAGLLATCPPTVIAHSGMDALTQAIEAYTSRKATWFSDCFALKAIELISANLAAVFKAPAGSAADDLLLGSYLGGVAFSHARLGVVHGLAHPLGVLYRLPHGLACAICLPHAMQLNKAAMGRKYDEVSRILGNDAVLATIRLNEQLGIISPLSGMEIVSRETIVRETLSSGSTAANPKQITAEDVHWLLECLFQAKSAG